ncbi:TetR/AcrR family transcriptional regulator [Phycicoccus sp. Root101]|uniref:TetR/AcrR family transcriptional regulator n=1 Tax=Phycicoccus sp. Root101 TaxID=1736421 RepID=UPI0012FC3681|nr:TetR/AcrR family transcriptional regulator [Phycicoccus sp. Root101]
MTPRAPAMAPDERRAAIIASTVPLLRDKGRTVSTKEIAKAAGVAEGTIFRVFESKDELVDACVHDAFQTESLVLRLLEIDDALPLRERLAAAVATMQDYLRGIFSLMTVLQAGGKPMRPPHKGQDPRRERANTAVDDAFVALIGADTDQLRLPARELVNYLRMLTLSSVHPMLHHQGSSPQELVDVILEGALRRPEGGGN